MLRYVLFLVKQDRIYWYRMPHMPDNEMKTFCEEGRIPEEYTHIICQKDEMKDVLSEEESGEHERMLIYGKKKDVRQYNTWTVKKDFSDVLSICTVSFKRILDLLRIVVPGQQLEKTLLSFGIKDMFRSGLKVSSIIDRGRR